MAFVFGGLIFLASAAHLLASTWAFDRYAQSRLSAFFLKNGELRYSRRTALATGWSFVLLGIVVIAQDYLLNVRQAVGALLLLLFTASMASAFADVRRYNRMHKARVAEIASEPGMWGSRWLWLPTAVAFLFGLGAWQDSKAQGVCFCLASLIPTFHLLNAISRLVTGQHFNPPGRHDVVGRIWSDWVLLPVWYGLAMWASFVWVELKRLLWFRGTPDWPWPF